MSSSSLRGKRVGLFTMDPGTTTGLSWSTPVLQGSTEEVFKRDPIETTQIPGRDREIEAADEIVTLFLDLRAEWRRDGIPDHLHFFVYEDFILYPDRNHSSDREGLSPVRITSLVQGMLYGEPIEWATQGAGLAKAVTNERLRTYGLWIRGMSKTDHAVDAIRHAVTWVRRQTSA